MPGPTLPSRVRRKLVGHKGPLHCIRFNEKGTYCMTGGQDRTINLWNPFRSDAEDMSKAYLIQSYTGPHGYEIKDLAISADNSRFVSVGADKQFYLWDVSTKRVVRKFVGHTSGINTVALNAEATVVVTGSYDRTVRVWDLRANNRDPIQVLSDFRDSVTRVRLTKDEILATSIDGTFRAYDLRTGTANVDDCHEALCSLALSNDGKCVLLSGLDGVIRLLAKETGELFNTYKGHLHTCYPVESCFDNTDAYVLTGSEDGTIHVYDLVETKEVKKLKEHNRAVCSLAYHPKDPCLITAGYDGIGMVWSDRGDD